MMGNLKKTLFNIPVFLFISQKSICRSFPSNPSTSGQLFHLFQFAIYRQRCFFCLTIIMIARLRWRLYTVQSDGVVESRLKDGCQKRKEGM
jgi:hypothetical protein